MRTFLIVALALFASVCAKNISPRDEEEATEAFIWCVIDALDGGLPEAEIPDHNPFISTRNLTFPLDLLGLNGYVHLDDVYIEHIINIEIRELSGKYAEDESSIFFNYSIYWEDMPIHGTFHTEFEDVVGFSHEYSGIFNLTLKDLVFSGIWDMSAGDVSPRTLNNFTLNIVTSETPFQTEGLGFFLDPTFSETVSVGLNLWINSDPDLIRDTVAPFLQQRFNDLWLAEDHTYRIDAILANCNGGAPTTTSGSAAQHKKIVDEVIQETINWV